LYDWWTHERAALLRGSHDVDVTVLDDAGKAVTTWAFEGCHLVALRYSPLDAVDSDVLMETAELSFDTVTQHARRSSPADDATTHRVDLRGTAAARTSSQSMVPPSDVVPGTSLDGVRVRRDDLDCRLDAAAERSH
jgi:hypothetical protein